MERTIVNVSWYDKNFGASLCENVPGAVLVTAKTYDELINEVRETLNCHIEDMIADGIMFLSGFAMVITNLNKISILQPCCRCVRSTLQ